MEKQLKDYLHFHIGAPVKNMLGGTMNFTISGLDRYELPIFSDKYGNRCYLQEWALVLRPIDSITDEEKAIITRTGEHVQSEREAIEVMSEAVRYMLSLNIDVFGLIDAGWAIEQQPLG